MTNGRKPQILELGFNQAVCIAELARKYHCTVPQIAMAWIYRQPLNCFAVVSTTKPERMQENIQAMELPLTEDEVLYLDLRKEAL